MKLSTLYDDVFMTGLKRAVAGFPTGAGAYLWWHPSTRQAFLSLGDWTDPGVASECRTAVAKVVGVNNITVVREAGPSDGKCGWYMVKPTKIVPVDFHDPYKVVTEGVVAAAKGDIINIVNDAAAKVSDAATAMGFPKPEVSFTDDNARPAVVNIEAGRNAVFRTPQTIAVTIHGDSEFKVELAGQLAQALNVAAIYPQRSADEVIERLQRIRADMREFHSEAGLV